MRDSRKHLDKVPQKISFALLVLLKQAIGHLDAGSCLAGIIKTALALKYELIPPSLNFEKPNSQIDFAHSPFYVNDKLKRWKKGDRTRRAGVSSFGLGGTNAHIILEEAPEIVNTQQLALNGSGSSMIPIPLSAKNKAVLEQQELNFNSFLERKQDVSLANIGYTLATGRAAFDYRKMLIPKTTSSEKLEWLVQLEGETKLKGAPIVFLFPGGGAQYLGMAKGLYEVYPYFKEQVDYCIDFLKMKENLEIKKYLIPTESAELDILKREIEAPTIALATLFTIEYALAKLWQFWGVQPTQMIGHSMGEYTAACIAGVFSVEDGLRLVVKRGRLFEGLAKEGAMLSVPLSEAEIITTFNSRYFGFGYQ